MCLEILNSLITVATAGKERERRLKLRQDDLVCAVYSRDLSYVDDDDDDEDENKGRDIDGAATNSRGGGHGVAHAIQSRDCVAGTANFAGVLSTASEITSGSGRGCRDGAGAGDSG
eukprot:CAMPEP_0173102048 /NCGR_PEP_ID=MMETSP1102-20130122/37285_1 /TAXON_ID=49646 /ORGANISM="Geminigera sp., Strain Caron Lab Isolate" /LENGTH=115 /DNA_ID=CAMNT_0013996043 /DNA_START=108 /DNA_END=451 /DNA_ORIENTATION=-